MPHSINHTSPSANGQHTLPPVELLVGDDTLTQVLHQQSLKEQIVNAQVADKNGDTGPLLQACLTLGANQAHEKSSTLLSSGQALRAYGITIDAQGAA